MTTKHDPDMTLQVAGKDRSSDLVSEVRRRAEGLEDEVLSSRLARESCLLGLLLMPGEPEYDAQHLEFLRTRNQVDVSRFRAESGGGWKARLSAMVKQKVWTLLRYQHAWISARQNAINVQLTYALEFEREERRRETAALAERIRVLEERGVRREEDVS